MKICAYCGYKNEDVHEMCAGCDERLEVEEPDSKFQFPLSGKPAKSRRAFSAVCSLLSFLIGPIEFGWDNTPLIYFLVAVPFLSLACVWYGAGRHLIIEAVGWILFLAYAVMILAPFLLFILSTTFTHWYHP